jgi:ankyrin repeat protein
MNTFVKRTVFYNNFFWSVGYTDLMYTVVVTGNTETAKLLIEKGANTGAIAADGETALSLAKKVGLLEEIVEMLEKKQQVPRCLTTACRRRRAACAQVFQQWQVPAAPDAER